MSLSAEAAISEPTDGERLLVIDAERPARWFDTREVWHYRELIWILAERDIKVRYRQALVGMTWVILQPVAQMLIFSGLFSLLGKQPVQEGIPYGPSVFCGLLLWQLFASIVASATNCLVENRQLLTKVYFPRIVLPLSACLRPLVDFAVGSIVLIVLLAWWHIVPGPALLLMPLVIVSTMLTALSLGLWLSALNAHYRDFGYIVPFLLQIGFFVSPVIYETASLIPDEWRLLHSLNPMASLLEAFRWSILGSSGPHPVEMLMSALATTFVLLTGAWYFRRVERFLADRI
jgi:lipopolysaccharide transport system permease protein